VTPNDLEDQSSTLKTTNTKATIKTGYTLKRPLIDIKSMMFDVASDIFMTADSLNITERQAI
jgi:hypothetical protein